MTGDIEGTLARIDERTKWICDTLKQQQRCDEDHEKRIRKLENADANAKGRNGALAAVVALGVSVIVSLISFFCSGGKVG